MTVGENIKKLRAQQGLSQAKLGELLNVSQQAVAKWEKAVAEPDLTTLVELANLFKVSVDYLIGHNAIKPSSEWTDEEKALGVDRRAVYLSEDEFDWLELRSEVIRTKGEDYLQTLITMIKAVTKS